MDQGLWAIWYEIADDQRAAYLDWFHRVHIPEKLARPGYRWAAHYELGHGGRGRGHVALFGGDTTHTFLDPSPRQLATRSPRSPGSTSRFGSTRPRRSSRSKPASPAPNRAATARLRDR